MNFPKIALKGSPTTIKQLESLGGSNPAKFIGYNNDYSYFIDSMGHIDSKLYCREPPEDYKLISHISELKSKKLFKLL